MYISLYKYECGVRYIIVDFERNKENFSFSLQLFDVECDLWEVYRVLHLTLSSEMPFFAMAICHI